MWGILSDGYPTGSGWITVPTCELLAENMSTVITKRPA